MEAFVLRLVNLSINASYLVLAVLLLRLLLRKAPRWIFCLLWGLVALRLICPFSIESALSLIPSAEPLPRDFIYTAVPEIQSGISAIDRLVNSALAGSMTPFPGSSVNPSQVWSFVLARVWAVGAGAMLLYALVSFLLLKRRMSTATLLRDNLRQSEQAASPFVLGLFRPVIYLPYHVADTDLPYVIAHEQAHIRRGDPWWKLLGFLLLAVYWFDPLLWLAYLLLCRDIEAACDERVIRGMEKEYRRGYSTALLHCSVQSRTIAACPLSFGEAGVKARVKAVMNYKKPACWVLLLAAAACLVTAVCFMTDPVTAVKNPWVQDYVPGTGNIRGSVDTQQFESISPDFAIGADRYGRAVFKDPYKAFATFTTRYADGIALIQAEYFLAPISRTNYGQYKTYGWQTTAGSGEARTQAAFVSKFLDIYENSFAEDIPTEDSGQTTQKTA